MTPGDVVTVYAVCRSYGPRLTIEVATATVRPSSLFCTGSTGLGFGCRRTPPLDTPTSQEAAVSRYIAERLAEIEAARKVIADQMDLIGMARELDVASR